MKTKAKWETAGGAGDTDYEVERGQLVLLPRVTLSLSLSKDADPIQSLSLSF